MLLLCARQCRSRRPDPQCAPRTYHALCAGDSGHAAPNAPLVLITLFVQVIAVTLLPAALVFLILLLNNEEIMGKYKNTNLQNIAATTIVVAIIVLSTLYGITTLFPGLLA
ncbi:MAG: divalent metal cation transporter [Methanoregula sp.]|nr:divalent metal cation transporter [Methanoregula sp.]